MQSEAHQALTSSALHDMTVLIFRCSHPDLSRVRYTNAADSYAPACSSSSYITVGQDKDHQHLEV